MMIRAIAIASAFAALTGCSSSQMASFQSQVNQVQPALQMACNDALTVANLAGLVPGVGAIVPYINAGCATAQGLAKLAADPSSAAWLGELTGEIKGLASTAGLKL